MSKPKFGCSRLCEGTTKRLCRCGPANLTKGDKGCKDTIFLPEIRELLSDLMAEQQQVLKEEIQTSLEQGKAMLALGAGISLDMGMPDWTGLLSRLSGYALQYKNYIADDAARAAISSNKISLRKLERELIEGKIEMLNGTNALEAAQYVSLTLGENPGERDELIKNVISEIIANNMSPQKFRKSGKCPTSLKDRQKKKGMGWSNEEKNALYALANKNSLFAVAYALQMDNGFCRALTYNYDTLVQEYLIDFFEVPKERIVTHPGEWTPIPKDIDKPIEFLHVHGCLPRPEHREDKTTAFPGESRQLVLSEDSYYNMERGGAYDWPSSVQSYYFNRDTCVFVGFSAEDYNFRRILRQMGIRATAEDPKHYLILTIDTLAKDIYSSICRSRLETGLDCIDELREDAKLLLNQELVMKAEYWKQYGFYPIWATTNDVPKILMSLVTDTSNSKA